MDITERIEEIRKNYYTNLQKQLVLVSPIPESVNHYVKPRAFIMNVKGRPTPQISMYETAPAKEFKKKFIQIVLPIKTIVRF